MLADVVSDFGRFSQMMLLYVTV